MSEFQWELALYHLRGRIVSGELLGGTKLRASHLAVEMGISRTPISEALIKLEGEGLLIRDKSGFTVRSFEVEEVFDAIELRGLLEGAAVQRAAERGISDDELEKLNAQLGDLDAVSQAGDVAEYDRLNLDFHNTLTELSGSDILIAEVRRAYRFPFAAPSAFPIQSSNADRFRASLIVAQAHHQQIVAAVSQREGARAFALLREHARLALHDVQGAISTKETAPQLALVKNAE